jgi:secreted PhoX family phosphatase
MAASRDGTVRWIPVPDPTVRNGVLTRRQAVGATRFKGAEGIWHHEGSVYWTVKGDNRIWALRIDEQRIEKIYDANLTPTAALQGVDNLVIASNGDLYVAEDTGTGGTMDICLITPDGVVSQFLRVTKQWQSELAGPAFDPSGTRLYFSSQRGLDGTGAGITYEVMGPFRSAIPAPL